MQGYKNLALHSSQCATSYVQEYMLFAAVALKWAGGVTCISLQLPGMRSKLRSEKIHVSNDSRESY